MIRIHCHDVFEPSDMPNPSQLLDFLRNDRRFITKTLEHRHMVIVVKQIRSHEVQLTNWGSLCAWSWTQGWHFSDCFRHCHLLRNEWSSFSTHH